MALADYFTGTYIGGAVAIVLVIWALWLLLRRPSGRLGEEKLEEKETDALKRDEVIVEATQIDEKKQCRRIRKIIDELWTLSTAVDANLVKNREAIKSIDLINLSLNRLVDEKMNVQVALETFRMLHESINFFISQLPKNSPPISRLIAEINELQKRYYADLIRELEMHKKEKQELLKLWRQERDQETGTGQLAA